MRSYHQVDFFNEIPRAGEVSLYVYYLRRLTFGRQWTPLQAIAHPHTFVRGMPVIATTATHSAADRVDTCVGRLIPPADAEALAAAMHEFATHTDLQPMSAAAGERSLAYDSATLARRAVAMLRAVIGQEPC